MGSGSAAVDSSETLTVTYSDTRCKNQEYRKFNFSLRDGNKPNLWFNTIIVSMMMMITTTTRLSSVDV